MQARMKNLGVLVPDAMQALQTLGASIQKGDLSSRTFHLVHLRVSQINGCAVCIDGGFRLAKKADESDERLFAVAAWRDAPHFTDAERAALALAEAVTRLSDRTDPVPDELWAEVKRHYTEKQLATLVLAISATNVWNRLNVTTRQVAGEWKP